MTPDGLIDEDFERELGCAAKASSSVVVFTLSKFSFVPFPPHSFHICSSMAIVSIYLNQLLTHFMLMNIPYWQRVFLHIIFVTVSKKKWVIRFIPYLGFTR
ncbi:unnamed protein product [Schistosoma margrebowiei]|uniref:Uncharacterized protein n=1 Tax=Schistosoma margrebowiei TaxID=48269 RepID=A0A183N9B1_9TREM|nr:unnamed protein product [Schistosoma margrebowiei]